MSRLNPILNMISERAIDEARPLKVIYIGAGISGIIAGIEFTKAVPSIELVIYEKNPEIGGTWYENKYPGCACDVPSHSYQLSFESSTDWTKFYAEAPEILEYWKKVAIKYDLRKHIRLSHQCIEARWDPEIFKWKVKLLRIDVNPPKIVEDEADVLMTGTGILNQWKWPDIKGLHTYKGELLHTANFNADFDPQDKNVAVIGGAASGIQVVPALISKVKRMDHYIRSRTWICDQIGADILRQRAKEEMSSNFSYTENEMETWRNDRNAYIEYRKGLETRLQGLYELSLRGNVKHDVARAQYEKNMRERLKLRPELYDQLLPEFPPFCKRIAPGPNYLEALMEPNLSLISDPIVAIDADGIITSDGIKRRVDAIICATGFYTEGSFGFPIYGRNGINLRTKMAEQARSYIGLCTDDFPNFFQSLGPNTWQGAGSLLITMEYIHRYVGQALRKLAYENVLTIEPKRKQVDNFTNFCEEYFKRTYFSANCTSWYKTGSKVTHLWPGSSIHALKTLERVRWEDFEIEYYDGNDFGWFGNGWSMADKNADNGDPEPLTWYLNGSKFLHEPLPSKKVRWEQQITVENDPPHVLQVNATAIDQDQYDSSSASTSSSSDVVLTNGLEQVTISGSTPDTKQPSSSVAEIFAEI